MRPLPGWEELPSFVILRGCDFFAFPGNANLLIGGLHDAIEENGAPGKSSSAEYMRAKKAVILRGCDFIDFSQKVALKTISLHAKKSRYLNKVTPSERSEESLLRKGKDQERFFARNRRSE